jgi:hypothetical protein
MSVMLKLVFMHKNVQYMNVVDIIQSPRRPKPRSELDMKLDLRQNEVVAWTELALSMLK